jgi:acetolactate synthase-1/2/3 large subunit
MAVGVRFDDRATSKVSAFAPHARIIHIDIDPVSIDRIVRTDLAIVSHCTPALKTLHRLSDEQGLTPPERQIRAWRNQLRQWKAEMPLSYCRNQNIKPQYVVEKLHQLTQGRAIIATEVGQNQMWAAQYYHFTQPRTFITSGGLGAMGFGLPAAIGAQVAHPKKLVIDIAGDGSIQMNIQELATAVENNLPVKVAILNNQFLGMVRQWQQLFYDRRYSCTSMTGAPDFVKLAEAYGAVGLRAEKPSEVTPVLEKALAIDRPVVMDFRVDREECVYPMVPAGASMTQMLLA